MKKILVIGGNGFIGSNLIRILSKKKDLEIYSFDLVKPLINFKGVKYLNGDFFDDYVLENTIVGIDCIIHSLSTINPGNSNEKFLQGYERDLIQTVKLCSMIVKRNINLIFLSSGGTVYGNQIKQPIDENRLPLPINHYGTIKLCIENIIRTFNAQLHKKMLIARISNPYGPGQDYHKGVGFVDAVIKKSLNNEPVEIWGDGENIRDYIYIDDICEMIYSLLEYDGEQEVFNISSNEGISQNKVIETVKLFIPSIKVIYKNSRSVDARKIILNNEKIMSIYGKKILTFKEGIHKYYTYLKKIYEINNSLTGRKI